MGEAKRRGTYEERVAMTLERKRQLKAALLRLEPPLREYAARRGIQRLATALWRWARSVLR